jgi:N-acyl-D-aspartate/D-glutamate deacylase
MLDCAITGGVVIDGTGGARRHGDVGIRDGRIVTVGKLEEPARRRIDAEGRVVAPGFIDVHTHYDAQVMWDCAVSPSSLHGVTTVIGGNCGFTIAPVNDDSADYVMRMLACVEGMSVKSLEGVLDFRWKTFADWLALLEGRLAVNAGFLVGHSTVRKLVMGDGWQETPNADQLRRMREIIDESVRGGALGFSSSWGQAHGDHLGNLVPSRYAGREELVALASVLRAHPGTMLEFIPPGIWSDDVIEMMIRMSVEANSPINWNLLIVGMGVDRAAAEARLAVSDRAAEQGGEIVALSVPLPLQLRINLMTTIVYNTVAAWPEVLALPHEDKVRALRDGTVRERLAGAVEERRRFRASPYLDFEKMTVQSVASPTLKRFEGRVVGDIARDRQSSALDTFLDIAVDDNLLACFETPPAGDDAESWNLRARYWQDPRVLVGGSDAGAHLDNLSTFAFFTDFVGPTVRERGLLTLEDAVHKVTDAAARFYGLWDRGRLAPGFRGDIVVFDPTSVRTGKVVLRQDMPKGEYRLFADALGVDHVIVNGTEIIDHGAFTGATPGTILRPGRDTKSRISSTP